MENNDKKQETPAQNIQKPAIDKETMKQLQQEKELALKTNQTVKK